MSRIVLGVSGSIAAYRACDLARDLMRDGHIVRVCLTDGAAQFVTPALFEALTGEPTLQHAFEEPEAGRMAHIDWAREADLLLIAPATANVLNKMASGQGDDMLLTIALAYDGPVVLAPAMNPSMLAHPGTEAAIATLAERGAMIVEPVGGLVACGEEGQGKLAPNETILEAVRDALGIGHLLQGKRVLITSGPTQEPIDDVRFLSNRSSGRMGAALARVALMMGADVTVVTGPTHVGLPARITVKQVRTADEMLAAALQVAPQMDWIIGAAAVADYRPAERMSGKRRRDGDNWTLELTPNPDIIAALAQACPGKVVAFAAEPSADPGPAREKMERKGVHAIALNDVSRPDIGFEVDRNALTLITRDTQESCEPQSKLGCARWLLGRLAGLEAEGRL